MLPLDRKLEIYEAKALSDYLFLRKLRNKVRHFMTNDTSRITLLQQIFFYRKKPPHLRIYVAALDGRRAGYLLLREAAHTTYITEAVDARFRGQGLASALVRHAQGLYPQLTADIRPENEASLRLHAACGFTPVSQDAAKAIYRWSAA